MARPIISSAQNPSVKEAMQLRRRRGRSRTDSILIDGLREIGRAIDAGVQIQELFFCEALAEPGAGPLVEQAAKAGAAIVEVSEGVFEKVRYGDRTGGVVDPHAGSIVRLT